MTLETNQSQTFDLGAIKAVESKGFNSRKYIGKRIKIAKIDVKQEDNFYGEDGLKHSTPQGKIWRCYIRSEPLPKLDEQNNFTNELVMFKDPDSGEMKPKIISARFNLNTNETTGEPEISKDPKAKLWPFMKKYEAKTLLELEGKFAMLDIVPPKEGEEEKMPYLTLR